MGNKINIDQKFDITNKGDKKIDKKINIKCKTCDKLINNIDKWEYHHLISLYYPPMGITKAQWTLSNLHMIKYAEHDNYYICKICNSPFHNKCVHTRLCSSRKHRFTECSQRFLTPNKNRIYQCLLCSDVTTCRTNFHCYCTKCTSDKCTKKMLISLPICCHHSISNIQELASEIDDKIAMNKIFADDSFRRILCSDTKCWTLSCNNAREKCFSCMFYYCPSHINYLYSFWNNFSVTGYKLIMQKRNCCFNCYNIFNNHIINILNRDVNTIIQAYLFCK
jgi:hypothetical protein